MSLGYLDMGLLSHAEQLLAVKLASQPAVFYSTQHKINDFHSFAEKVGVMRACILVPYGKRFFMQYEHGFDAISIFKSVSSTDFWNGTLPENNDWYTFNGVALEPFYQLFSKSVVENLVALHMKTLTIIADVPIKVIMIVADDIIDKALLDENIPELGAFIADDLSSLNTVFSTPHFSVTPTLDVGKMFTMETVSAIAEIADDLHIDAEALEILSPVVVFESFNRIKKLLFKDDFCIPGENCKLRILFSQAPSLDNDLLQFQLQKNLLSFFDKATSKIYIETAV